MSDPEVPQPEKPSDVDDVVDSAKAGLDAAAAAGASVPASATDADASALADDADASAPTGGTDAPVSATDGPAPAAADIDPDLAAFEEMEKAHPGTFGSATAEDDAITAAEASETSAVHARSEVNDATVVVDESPAVTSVYDAPEPAQTQIVPDEPVIAATPAALQPIFVQAPEPPRDRGNRGTAGAIGLLATIVFAVLYLGTVLGLGAIAGDVTGENIGEAALAPLTTWAFWVPVAMFFLGFWLLGAIINRGRWGRWVILGIFVGIFAYAGHILGQLFEAPFWLLTPNEGGALVEGQLLTPLAIAAFVFGRELTIWFGAWVARSGARKTELNLEAQREYERTLEAGPTLPG